MLILLQLIPFGVFCMLVCGHLQGTTFPENIGLPFSGTSGAQYVVMATHYHNPELKDGIYSTVLYCKQ